MANEKRLIDANALKESVKYIPWCDYEAVNRVIDEEPTVDAVEVVRCESCLYRSQYSDMDGRYKCGFFSIDGVAMMVSPDFYCKCGERRTDG